MSRTSLGRDTTIQAGIDIRSAPHPVRRHPSTPIWTTKKKAGDSALKIHMTDRSPDALFPPEVLSVMRATTDRLETQVYYVAELDLFHTINYHARPTADDMVVVNRLKGPGLAIEPFRGQSFIGVAEILYFYQFSQSDQRMPTNLLVHPD